MLPKITIKAAICFLVLAHSAGSLQAVDRLDRTKVAEGSYVRKSGSGTERLDRWVLWRQPDRSYQLSSTLFPDGDRSGSIAVEQITDFDSVLRMQRFVLKGRNEKQSGSLSCELGATQLRCRSDISGQLSSGSTAVEGAYIVAPMQQGENNDVPWLLTPLLRLAPRDVNKMTCVQYIIVWPDEEFEFEPLVPVEVRYTGKEIIDVMGRKVSAHRYEVTPEHTTVWTGDKGILLAYEKSGKDGYRVELDAYVQYEDLVEELKQVVN